MSFVNQELRAGVLALMGATVAADDQAQAMTDEELGRRLFEGKWSTIDVQEAARRLINRGSESE